MAVTYWGSHMVFKAIKFINVNLETANSRANRNGNIYLNVDGTPKAYWLGTDNPP